MPDTCVFYGEALARYAFGGDHPFGADRLPAFWTELQARRLDRKVAVEQPASCGDEDLLRFHGPAYVDRVKEASILGRGYLDYGDTPAFPGVYDVARLVAGTTLQGVRLIMNGSYRRAFNPIGGLHHARRDRAGGFCVFNDVGIAIEFLRKEHGIRRIGYVDIDAHHGDGVYYEYELDPELSIADIHEDGRYLYPGTGYADEEGKGPAKGTKLNLPIQPGAGEREFEAAFEKAEAFIDAAKPEFIILQCGADSISGDPLTHLRFSPRGHGLAAARLRTLADRYCGGKLLALGGGGYNRQNLARAWSEVVEALA